MRDPAIDEYLRKTPPAQRAMLRALRKTIHGIVPEVEECISYRLPAFRYRGEVIAGFSATASGCSYYPFSGRTLAALGGHRGTKGALHFDAPLPASVVRKLLETRIAELGRVDRHGSADADGTRRRRGR